MVPLSHCLLFVVEEMESVHTSKQQPVEESLRYISLDHSMVCCHPSSPSPPTPHPPSLISKSTHFSSPSTPSPKPQVHHPSSPSPPTLHPKSTISMSPHPQVPPIRCLPLPSDAISEFSSRQLEVVSVEHSAWTAGGTERSGDRGNGGTGYSSNGSHSSSSGKHNGASVLGCTSS